MKRWAVLAAALLLVPGGARAGDAVVQRNTLPAPSPALAPETANTGSFQPAPIPNPDVAAPRAPAASNDPSLTPGLFMPRDRFAGDGFTPGSTVQTEQERRRQPGAGLNLRLPFD